MNWQDNEYLFEAMNLSPNGWESALLFNWLHTTRGCNRWLVLKIIILGLLVLYHSQEYILRPNLCKYDIGKS